MKKTLSLILAACISISLFAVDLFSFIPMEGNIKNYTKTDYTIVSKFGSYFRTPNLKTTYSLDEDGKEIESSEFDGKNVLRNKIKSNYDSDGKLISQIYYDSDTESAEISWKTEIKYSEGLKSEVSEYNSANILRGKTIYTYSYGRLIDESLYDGNGTLTWKIVYSYDKDDRIDTIAQYFSNGSLSEKAAYHYDENGVLTSISHYDSFSKVMNDEKFVYNSKGQLEEIRTFDEMKQVTNRLSIKYNDNGNVIKISNYAVAPKFGTIVNELTSQTEFEYEYADGETLTIIPE